MMALILRQPVISQNRNEVTWFKVRFDASTKIIRVSYLGMRGNQTVENFFGSFCVNAKYPAESRNIPFFAAVVGKNVIGDEERGSDL